MKLKKLLALLMALMMAVCVFAACGDDADTSKEKDDEKQEEKADEKENKEEPAEEPEEEISDEDAVKETVAEFAELYFAGDEKALEYVDENAEGYEEIKKGIEEMQGMEEKFTGMAEGLGLSEEYNEDVEKIINDFANDVFGKMSITVNSVEVDGDEAVAKCTFTSPDFKIESLLNEELIMEAMYSVFTEEEIAEINNADEATQAKASLKLADAMFDLLVEKIEVTSVELDYNLNKVDGEWIITNMN